jgi:hypothetical protein
MRKMIVWAARLGLLLVLGVCVAGAVDPRHNAAAAVPAADIVEHVIYGYLLTLLTILALPRISPWWVGGFYAALGAGFEAVQVAGWVSGTFEPGDVVANLVGVAAALVPIAVGRTRR